MRSPLECLWQLCIAKELQLLQAWLHDTATQNRSQNSFNDFLISCGSRWSHRPPRAELTRNETFLAIRNIFCRVQVCPRKNLVLFVFKNDTDLPGQFIHHFRIP